MDESELQMVKRRPDFHIVDWLNDIPYMYKLVEILSIIISVLAVIFWGAYKLASKIPVPKIQKKVLSRILRTTLLVFLVASGFYLLKMRGKQETAVSQPLTPNSSQSSDFDSLWVLIQNQINPIVKKLSVYNQKLEELELLAKDSRSKSVSSDIISTIETLRFEMEQKIDSTIAEYKNSFSKIEQVKETVLEESRDLAIEQIRSFAQNFLPNDQNVQLFTIEEINQRMQQIMSNVLGADDRGNAFLFHKYGPDYALYSAGSTIDNEKTTETFRGRNQEISKLLRLPTGPELILDQNLDPGHCWAMKGTLLT